MAGAIALILASVTAFFGFWFSQKLTVRAHPSLGSVRRRVAAESDGAAHTEAGQLLTLKGAWI